MVPEALEFITYALVGAVLAGICVGYAAIVVSDLRAWLRERAAEREFQRELYRK